MTKGADAYHGASGWTRYAAGGIVEDNRNTMPSIPTLEAICRGMGITLSQFFANGDMVELTPELMELFDSWVNLTPEQKAAALQLLKAMSHDR